MSASIAATRRRLEHLSAATIGDAVGDRSVLILPIGAVEQHGPHLPYSTDLVVIDAYADAVVAEFGDALDLWRLPTLPYSKSNEHAW